MIRAAKGRVGEVLTELEKLQRVFLLQGCSKFGFKSNDCNLLLFSEMYQPKSTIYLFDLMQEVLETKMILVNG